MEHEGHIGLLQGTILLYAVLTAKIFLEYPSILIHEAGPAAWQAALVMTAGTLLLYLPTGALARRFPGRSLAAINVEVAGAIFGPLLTLGVALWLLTSVALTIRDFTETFIVALLPTTPPSVMMSVILICLAYASYRGLEPLSRAAQIFFPLILVAAVLVLILSLPRGDTSLLYPFWGHGLPTTVSNGLYNIGMLGEVIILLVLGYAFRDGKSVRTSGLLGILLAGLSIALSLAVEVMVFGAEDGAQQGFPLLTLVRLVYLGRFLQRVEALIVMFWFFAAAVRLSAIFHAAVVAVTDGLRLPSHRPVIFPLAIIVGSLSLLPTDLLVVIELDRTWTRPMGIWMVITPLALLLLAMLRKKGVQSHAA